MGLNKQVTFSTAKLLKEKGWNKPTLHFYFEDGVLIENSFKGTVGMDYGSEFEVEFSELTENWNNGWVRKKGGDMCFGCSKSKGYLDIYSAPTISEVLALLYKKYDIWIHICYMNDNKNWWWDCYKYKEENGLLNEPGYSDKFKHQSPTEAYEVAIEYCLKNLI